MVGRTEDVTVKWYLKNSYTYITTLLLTAISQATLLATNMQSRLGNNTLGVGRCKTSAKPASNQHRTSTEPAPNQHRTSTEPNQR